MYGVLHNLLKPVGEQDLFCMDPDIYTNTKYTNEYEVVHQYVDNVTCML